MVANHAVFPDKNVPVGGNGIRDMLLLATGGPWSSFLHAGADGILASDSRSFLHPCGGRG